MDKGVKQTFGKNERLCGFRVINELFETGSVFYTSLFRVVWMKVAGNCNSPARIAVSVPKRNIKLAVSRNLVKRRIREAYRRKKHRLYMVLKEENLQIVFALIYRGNEPADYTEIQSSVGEVIDRLSEKVARESVKS